MRRPRCRARATSSSSTTQGDVVSMTTSVESLFGSGRAVGGFFLNNQLTDFSFTAVDDARVARWPMRWRAASGRARRCRRSIVLRKDGRRLRRRPGFAGRVGHPRLQRQGAGRPAGLGPAAAGRDQPAQRDRARRRLLRRDAAHLRRSWPRSWRRKASRSSRGAARNRACTAWPCAATPPAFEAGADPRREGVWRPQ